MDKLWYIQIVLKTNELCAHEKTRSNVKCISLSERNQCEKDTKYCMIPIILHSGKHKTVETKKDQWFLVIWAHGVLNI